MTQFLKIVAEDLYNRLNGHLEDVAVVFPNKRASLFFSEHLLAINGRKPMWSPRYMTIGELFQQNSTLTVGDSILLVSKLYRQYVRPIRADETEEEYEKSVESLDNFYYWGEMLLSDFDDIDKHLADPKQLFANIKELREMGIAKVLLYTALVFGLEVLEELRYRIGLLLCQRLFGYTHFAQFLYVGEQLLRVGKVLVYVVEIA